MTGWSEPPATISAMASASQRDIGPHQKSSGSARVSPSTRKQRTSPKFEGLKTWRPRQRIRCFDRSETAAVPAKIHAPWRLHQSPCGVPGTRRMNATPLPVSSALAGHMSTCWRKKAMPTSSTAHVPIATRIWAIERLKPNAVWPRTCSVMITAARWRRGSRNVGQQDRVLRSPDRQHRPAGDGGGAHGRSSYCASPAGRPVRHAMRYRLCPRL